MADVEGSILIHAAPERVFDFVAYERNEPSYNPRMLLGEQITDGPIGAGTKSRAEITTMGRKVDMVIERTPPCTDGERRPRLRCLT